MIPLALQNGDDGADGITWQEISCCISFWSYLHNKWNGAIGDTACIM